MNVRIYIADLYIAQYFRGPCNSWKTGPLRLHEATIIALTHADVYTLA